jgi:hypothetical protein
MTALAPAKPKIVALSPFDYLNLAIPRTWIGMPCPGNPKFVDNGGIVPFQLQQDGYGSRMMVVCQLLVTVAGTVTSGTIASQAPFCAVRNLQFGPNGTVILRNHSGWGAYKHNRYRMGLDLLGKGAGDKFSGQALASLGITQSGGLAQEFTTVTNGATSATQTLGSTAGMFPGKYIYFATAAVYRQISSITSATVVVLTASVTSTTGEAVTLANGSAVGGALIPVPGAPICAGTYALNLMLPLPIAYNLIGQSALLDLNNQSIYTLNITCGNMIASLNATGGTSDLFNTLIGTGLSYTVTGQFYATYEVFPYLRTDQYDYHNQYDTVMTVLEQTFPIATGANPTTIPRGDKYSMVLAEMLDNNKNPIPDSSLTSFQITYGGSQVMLQQDRYTNILRSYCDHAGLVPMDGLWDIDLGLRTGQLDLRDEFDNFRNQAINNWTINPTIGGNITAGSMVLTMECLQAA